MNYEENYKKVNSNKSKVLLSAVMLCSLLAAPSQQALALESDNVNIQATGAEMTCRGAIVDKQGNPIIGASITVSGASKGTITDVNGRFELRVASDAMLVISYIGYKTQRIAANSPALTYLYLEEDTEVLDEVVVVGYGQVKRANLTGAVSNVEMKNLEDMPTTNLTSALMGTMAGVTVGESTGNPIGTPTITIRTNGSWNANAPLYVIDGFIRDADAFNLLDPTEVENISVLKDAAAAVYGVRGSGGVVLVTTRKGQEGKAKINYTGSYGISMGVSMPEMMSAYQQGVALNDMTQEEIINGTTTSYSMFTDEELSSFKKTNYDWLDMAWQNAQNTRHALNISGGTDKVKYFLGGSYMWAEGNFKGLNVDRMSLKAGVDINFTSQLKGSFNINYSNKDYKMPLNSKDKEYDRMYGTFGDLVRMPQWVPAYIDGKAVGNGMDSNATHPLEVIESGSHRRSKSDDISFGAKLDYEIKEVPGLKVSLQGNYSKSNSTGKNVSRPYSVYTFETNQIPYYQNGTEEGTTAGHLFTNNVTSITTMNNGNQIAGSSSSTYSYQINPSISYNTKIEDHDFGAMVVFEQSESGGDALSMTRNTMIIDGMDSSLAYEGDVQTTSITVNTLSRRQSFIGRFNYTYKDKYNVEASGRYEASTNFAKDYRWGFFPSVSAGWRISEENFFKDNVEFMDLLKVRASFGQLGNDKVNSISQYKKSYIFDQEAYQFGAGTLLTGIIPNGEGLVVANSTWEKTNVYNIGIDTRFFESLTFNIDGYYKHTFDILDDKKSEFPQNSGVSAATPKLNYGIMNAWGLEFELGYSKRIDRDWTVNAKANLSWASNEVVKKSQNPGIKGTWQDEEGRIRGGEDGLKTWRGGLARTWQDVEDYKAYLKSNLADPNGAISVYGITEEYFRPGMLMYQDLGTSVTNETPDGKISQEGDFRIINKYDSAPFNYGFSLGFTWKDIKFDALFTGSFGNDVIYDKGFYTASSGNRIKDFLSTTSNQLKEWSGNYAVADPSNGYALKNPNAKYPRLDSYSFRGYRSDFWMTNGHILRLRSINVSYNLPRNYAKVIGVDALRVFFQGNNLWTIINPYPYKDASVGYWSDYPQIRTLNFGINLSL